LECDASPRRFGITGKVPALPLPRKRCEDAPHSKALRAKRCGNPIHFAFGGPTKFPAKTCPEFHRIAELDPADVRLACDAVTHGVHTESSKVETNENKISYGKLFSLSL